MIRVLFKFWYHFYVFSASKLLTRRHRVLRCHFVLQKANKEIFSKFDGAQFYENTKTEFEAKPRWQPRGTRCHLDTVEGGPCRVASHHLGCLLAPPLHLCILLVSKTERILKLFLGLYRRGRSSSEGSTLPSMSLD